MWIPSLFCSEQLQITHNITNYAQFYKLKKYAEIEN